MSPQNQDWPRYSDLYGSWVLGLLFLIYAMNYVDRALLNIVGQAVKQDLGLTDLQLGLASGAAFALINGLVSIPVARLAEHRSRVAIISTALAFWSVMTALCGMAHSFLQLLLARAGVGVGEGGGVAPSHSLIADYFPVHKRGLALAIFGAATPVGMLVGALGSGWITEQFSWRVAFIAIGLPGVLVALVALATLKEPPRGYSDGIRLQGAPPAFGAVVRLLSAQPVYVHLVLAGSILNFAFFGFLTFLHPFMIRSMHLGYGEAATFFGLVTGIASGIGNLSSGFLADRLARRDRRWYLWIPALGSLVAAPAFALGLVQTDWRWAAAWLVVGGSGAASWYGPSSAVMHGLVEPRMRATAIAISALVMLLLGVALGPAFVGLLSDVIGRAIASGDCPGFVGRAICRGPAGDGLRLALIATSPLYLWAGAHYAMAARSLARAPGLLGAMGAPPVPTSPTPA